MTDSTPTVRKVRLKRVAALRRGDVIEPGLGLFTRDGTRVTSQAAMTDTWGRDAWFVVDVPWMDDLPELCVTVRGDPDDVMDDVLHTPLDAWVVLA